MGYIQLGEFRSCKVQVELQKFSKACRVRDQNTCEQGPFPSLNMSSLHHAPPPPKEGQT